MVHHIKNEFLDFKAFPSASVFVEFKKLKGKSIEVAIQESPDDAIELMAKLVYLAYKSFCRLSNQTPELTEEKIMDGMSLQELSAAIRLLMGSGDGEQKKT